jgi:hypothetical protein
LCLDQQYAGEGQETTPADPENSAFRQTVRALWVIQGLIGLLIAAVGILGATIESMLHKDRHSQEREPLPCR